MNLTLSAEKTLGRRIGIIDKIPPSASPHRTVAAFRKLTEFLALTRKAHQICDSSETWETKYRLNCSLYHQMYQLYPFDYYTSYPSFEADVWAFCAAATRKARNLEQAWKRRHPLETP